MTNNFYNVCFGVSLALMSAMVTPMMADEWNKETKLEFSGPVEVPGKVLTAGKYVFKLADSQGDRNIVEIFSEDANGAQKLVTTILAIPTNARRRRTSRSSNLKSGRRAAPKQSMPGFIPVRIRMGVCLSEGRANAVELECNACEYCSRVHAG